MKGISEGTMSMLFWVIFAVAAVLVLLTFLTVYGGRMFPIQVT